MDNRLKKITVLFLTVSLLAGCKSIGPQVLFVDRYNYNQSMERSNNQELLLNIVRLRYDESTMILKVNNISGSANFQRNATILADFFSPARAGSGQTNRITPSGTVMYADNPIISYTPMDDQAFTRAFLQTLSLGNMALLLESSSWSIPRVMRVGLQQVGNAHNAPSAARPTTSHVPEYQLFIDMTYVLRRMQLAEAVNITYVKQGDASELVMEIAPNYRLTAHEKATLRKAGVEIYNRKIIFSNKPGPHRTYVVTRSMFGIMNYLSKGIDVPLSDIKRKIATQTKYANGAVFDWQKVLNGMIKIYSSDTPPIDAYLSIFYRNHWFYIKDSDTNSKQTLVLLSSMAGLIQSGTPVNSMAPGLTRTV